MITRKVVAAHMGGSIVAVVLGLLVTCCVGCEFSATPKVVKPPTGADSLLKKNVVVAGGNEFDFGTMEVGQEFQHVFVVTNKNETEITVDKGPPSCATCTSFEIEKHVLKPGESMNVTVKWHIKAENPEFRQYAPLMLSDGGQVRLHVVGKVLKRIVLQPSDQWDLGEMFDTNPREFKAGISSGILDNFQIESIVNKNPALKVSFAPLDAEKLTKLKAKSGYELTAILAPTIPVGEFKDSVKINVLAPNPIALKVDVVARRTGIIQIFGPSWHEQQKSIGLGSFNPKDGLVEKLNLTTRGIDSELVFTKVTVNDPRATVELKPDARFKEQIGEYRRYELTIKLAPSDKAMVFTRQEPLVYEIETNQPLVGTIKLNVRCQGIP